jgi:hypothetical protein
MACSGAMSILVYIAACIIVPAAWGVLMYVCFNAIDSRRLAQRQADAPPPIDYSI